MTRADDWATALAQWAIEALPEDGSVFEPRPPSDRDVEFTRIRLCLTAERDTEIRKWIEDHPVTVREMATIWWDV